MKSRNQCDGVREAAFDFRRGEVSEQLGVPEGVLYNWKQKHLAELEQNAPEGAQSPKAMAEELAQLRKELAKQKRMNEILKKTVGFFSNPE